MRKLSILTLLSLTGFLIFCGCKKKEIETEQQETGLTDDTEKEENPEKEDPGTASLQIDELFKTLTNGVLRGEKEIDVRNFNIPETKADSIYKKFLAENPLLFHLKIANNIGYITDSELPENLQAYIPMYACNPSYIQEVFPKMEKSIEEYYQHLDYRMSPAEIAYTLYQKICKEVIYGERNDEFPYLVYSAFSAVGVFLPKKAVCQGYSLSYSLLMNGIGITTDYVTGPIPGASGHMWNRVYLDGNWYHADATFDDGSSIMQNNVYSINKYFLNSDNLFYTVYKHTKPHPNLPARIYTESGNKFDSEQCVIRRYDSQNNIIKTEAMYADGNWYYLSRKNEKMQIIKSDFYGNHPTILRQLQIPSIVNYVDKVQFTQNRIFFLDHIDNSYHICSVNYDGSNFKKEKKLSFIEASDDNLKLSQDETQPTHIYKGVIALKAELMLAKLRLLYYHGEDDYFNLEQAQAKELEQLISKAESFLQDKQANDDQADIIAKELKNKREAYQLPLSIKA